MTGTFETLRHQPSPLAGPPLSDRLTIARTRSRYQAQQDEQGANDEPRRKYGHVDAHLHHGLRRRVSEDARTPERTVCAAHLLPHLEPGMRLLDLGCGPGTISVGLAESVAPGALHGIDMEETQVDMANAAAKAGGHDNATFQTGDATDLPSTTRRSTWLTATPCSTMRPTRRPCSPR